MAHEDPLLTATPVLDFGAAPIAQLIDGRGWRDLSDTDKIGAVYDFVRNEIAFGYNRADDIPASEVLSDGYGQCTTNATRPTGPQDDDEDNCNRLQQGVAKAT